LRATALTARVGLLLGVAFGTCFLTGLYSHLLQHQPTWLPLPNRPTWLYQLTQGVHVATGLVAIPLLLVKLWTVYPKLFAWPPARDLLHALERGSLLLLVAGAVFELVTGLSNIALWYPWQFFFTDAHYATAWIVIGAVLIHIAAKLTLIRTGLRTPLREEPAEPEPAGAPAEPAPYPGLSRRQLLATTGAAAGVITVATVGQTVGALHRVSVLGPRDPRIGPQGLPVNKSAAGAGVTDRARDPDYRLSLLGPHPVMLTLADLNAMPQHAARLPIACVEGWSATKTWSGVRLRDLLDLAGFPHDGFVVVESLQHGGRYRAAEIGPPHSRDPLTLLALRVDGEVLHVDHGYPARLIAPARPGVLQTKWVGKVRPR
jgi:DMSO/TMAO reductase YedYZ molybdopterin-dependent catalytic subunit